jgi:hypothetical protein
MTSQKDILAGRQEIAYEHRRGSSTSRNSYSYGLIIPLVEFDIVFGRVEGHSRHLTEPVTLTLTITVSANASSSGPVADSQVEMLHTLGHAQEVVDAMKTWESAVGVIKQVMDHVGPIVKVCLKLCFYLYFVKLISVLQLFPHAVTAWGLLSHIPTVRLILLEGTEYSLFFFTLPLDSATTVQT